MCDERDRYSDASVRRARRTAEGDRADLPSAGPHARADLTDQDKTPGTGMLPPLDGGGDGNMQPGG